MEIISNKVYHCCCWMEMGMDQFNISASDTFDEMSLTYKWLFPYLFCDLQKQYVNADIMKQLVSFC